MPNRMLREGIISSDKVNKLSWPAEVFYRRLMSVADDFGFFDARPELLRPALYPLQLNKVTESDIAKWLDESSGAGLVRVYTVKGKDYLQIIDFNQRLRIKNSKYPPPENECQTDDRHMSDEWQTHDGRREEKRIEEKRSPEQHAGNSENGLDLRNSNLYRQPVIPSKNQVWEVFSRHGGTKEMAKKFYETNESVGWFYKGNPITNFAAMIPGYIAAWVNKSKPVEKKIDTSDYLKQRQLQDEKTAKLARENAGD